MATVRGCSIPEDRYYWVEKYCWARLEADGNVTIGITDVAQNLAKGIVNATPKEAGRAVQKGKSAGTLESGKWVGPFPAPFSCEIVETNEEGFARNILLANKEPYIDGWLVKVKPTDLEKERGHLVTGDAAVEEYKTRIQELKVNCLRCID